MSAIPYPGRVDNSAEIGYRPFMSVKLLQKFGGIGTLSLLTGLCLTGSDGVLAEGFKNYENEVFAEVEKVRGLPVRGTTTKTVLAEHGDPMDRNGPVGDPPISSWHYENFDVYFEHQLVITTVDKEDTLPTELEDIQ
jgi:hypothetical protein